MTREQYMEAHRLAGEIAEQLREVNITDLRRPSEHRLKKLGPLVKATLRLKKMLTPPPTMAEILAMIPAASHKERAKTIGLSRQGYYNLAEGTARRSSMTAKRLAELTGVPESTIREIW